MTDNMMMDQILFDLVHALALIDDGIPTEDVHGCKMYITDALNDARFWAFRLWPEEREAATELINEVFLRYFSVFESTFNNVEIKYYSNKYSSAR